MTSTIHLAGRPDELGRIHGVYVADGREMRFRLEPEGEHWRIVDAADGALLTTVPAEAAWPIEAIATALKAKYAS